MSYSDTISKIEKYPVISMYGDVKVGKSTLVKAWGGKYVSLGHSDHFKEIESSAIVTLPSGREVVLDVVNNCKDNGDIDSMRHSKYAIVIADVTNLQSFDAAAWMLDVLIQDQTTVIGVINKGFGISDPSKLIPFTQCHRLFFTDTMKTGEEKLVPQAIDELLG